MSVAFVPIENVPEVEAALLNSAHTPEEDYLTEISMHEQLELDLDDDA